MDKQRQIRSKHASARRVRRKVAQKKTEEADHRKKEENKMEKRKRRDIQRHKQGTELNDSSKKINSCHSC